MTHERVKYIHLKDQLIAAARRGVRVKIRTPFFEYDGHPSEEEAENIYREYGRAADEFHGKGKDWKK